MTYISHLFVWTLTSSMSASKSYHYCACQKGGSAPDMVQLIFRDTGVNEFIWQYSAFQPLQPRHPIKLVTCMEQGWLTVNTTNLTIISTYISLERLPQNLRRRNALTRSILTQGSATQLWRMMRAGTPTATQWHGRSVTTTLPAPTLLPGPISIGPNTLTPAPRSTPWPA